MRLAIILAAVPSAAHEVPRPEVPDPQFERPLWQTLNGPWEFEFDDSDVGLAENRAAGTRRFARSILVPFCFESRKSGIGETGFRKVAVENGLLTYDRKPKFPSEELRKINGLLQ